MAIDQINDWEEVKDITHDVVEEQIGRGTAYDETVAGTLGVKGQYRVCIKVIKINLIHCKPKIISIRQFITKTNHFSFQNWLQVGTNQQLPLYEKVRLQRYYQTFIRYKRYFTKTTISKESKSF